jgi:hypothetical protein
MKTLKETAVVAEREMITPFFQWRYNGRVCAVSFVGRRWPTPRTRRRRQRM